MQAKGVEWSAWGPCGGVNLLKQWRPGEGAVAGLGKMAAAVAAATTATGRMVWWQGLMGNAAAATATYRPHPQHTQ